MRTAHHRIMEFDYDNTHGGSPGTTCVAALIKDDKLYFGHAGDSRLYVLRDDQVLTCTKDHSLVTHWIEWGIISAQEARHHPQRNQITNCLGGAEDVFFMEMGMPLDLQAGDVVLLASDGLWTSFSDAELAQALGISSPDQVLDSLISTAFARENGRADNITGLLLHWGDQNAASFNRNPISHILEIL